MPTIGHEAELQSEQACCYHFRNTATNMPALDTTVVADLTRRLHDHLQTLDVAAASPTFVNAGGSAAVFRVETPEGARAFKVFDPRFLEGAGGPSERNRLALQRRLIGHDCPYLVRVHSIDEAEGTAFVEMEFCPWQQMSKCLSSVPDSEVPSLVSQLVTVVRFLEDRNIVHRDIKPENIHLSPDFKVLKVLDLGVARLLDTDQSVDAGMTDRESIRPFLATAQYSSPEYLFRLDEPTPRLWKALNFYQVGAVLHDLIMKSALFQEEVEMGNRWLVARAVLTKTPSFADVNPNRLAGLKGLSARCLVKDLETRLQIVSWTDFDTEGSTDPLTRLRGRLQRGEVGALAAALESRVSYERATFAGRFVEAVKLQLIEACGTRLPLIVRVASAGTSGTIRFEFTPSERVRVTSSMNIRWEEELFALTATIMLGDSPVCTVTVAQAEELSIYSVSRALANVVADALDLIESNEIAELGGTPVAGGRGVVEVIS